MDFELTMEQMAVIFGRITSMSGKISAIRYVREKTGAGLKEAKLFVEHMGSVFDGHESWTSAKTVVQQSYMVEGAKFVIVADADVTFENLIRQLGVLADILIEMRGKRML